MGITLSIFDGGSKVPEFPREIVMRLECDVATEFFCRGFEEFRSPDGFVGCHRDAMKRGWLERYQGARTWLCPQCSGKSPT